MSKRITMSVPDHQKLTVAEFLDAVLGEEGRFELVDGVAYAMAGAKQGHNVIGSNVQTALVPAGKKSGCRTTSSDTGVQTGPNTVRYPDIVVDCGPPNPSATTASQPTIIVEVSSPGTAVFDHGAKLREYQSIPSVQVVVQIESEIVLVKAHRRSGADWIEETYESLEDSIELPALATALSLREVYDTLEVRPRVRLQVIREQHPTR